MLLIVLSLVHQLMLSKVISRLGAILAEVALVAHSFSQMLGLHVSPEIGAVAEVSLAGGAPPHPVDLDHVHGQVGREWQARMSSFANIGADRPLKP